jgi:hypothetical protein
MSSQYTFNVNSYDTRVDALNALIAYKAEQTQINDEYDVYNHNSSIITLHCGHYISKQMLDTNIFPKFLTECDDSMCTGFSCYYDKECGHNDDDDIICDYCSSNCVFVCTKCNTQITNSIPIYDVQFCGLPNWLDTHLFNKNIRNKRKADQLDQ